MERTPDFRLGINMGFAINRFPEPEVWVRLVRDELGLEYVQFVADLLNPYLPQEIIAEQVNLIRHYTKQAGVIIQSTFTSAFTRVNHLMHPDGKQRTAWLRWFQSFARISAQLGAEAMGSHFGIMSVNDWKRPEVREQRVQEAVEAWQAISEYACEVGLKYLLVEPMSIPRENGWTIEEAQELRGRVNEKAAIPMEFCLDIGHAPHPAQRDPYLWIAKLGVDSPVIHLQQTESGHSRHWPFTKEFNSIGVIDARRVLEALADTGRDQFYLFFEISHRERWPDDLRVVDDLRESVEYWKTAIFDYYRSASAGA